LNLDNGVCRIIFVGVQWLADRQIDFRQFEAGDR
jgi:hypothetical protein